MRRNLFLTLAILIFSVDLSAQVIETRIDGEFKGWEGETIFKMMNGQIWQQSSFAYMYHYAYSPEVIIYKTSAGFVMKVDGVNETINVVIVNKIKSSNTNTQAIETRIDGEFEGWEGETIFKMMNGQIWQQSSFAYMYHYAYSPEVIIYKTSTGHVMKVDGVNETINVTKLK
jgi:hypothetical protein